MIAAGSDKTVEVEPNSVLRMAFTYSIPERTPYNPLQGLSFLGIDGEQKSVGLNDILANIKKAKTDTDIKGIFLDESYMTGEQATTEEIRNALLDFKKSGKFIVAYSEIYTQGFYYLASVADKVYINPKGSFEFTGFSSQVTFLKGALDKLGIEAQIIKVGTYKSAVEPLFLTKMSDANRLQVTSYLGSLYDHFLTGISTSRNINKDTLFNYANELKIRLPEDALKYKLVDGLKYKDEILDELKQRTGADTKQEVNTVELADYTKRKRQKRTKRKKIQKIELL
jgi:protease-4